MIKLIALILLFVTGVLVGFAGGIVYEFPSNINITMGMTDDVNRMIELADNLSRCNNGT